jgi:hypothetical protein
MSPIRLPIRSLELLVDEAQRESGPPIPTDRSAHAPSLARRMRAADYAAADAPNQFMSAAGVDSHSPSGTICRGTGGLRDGRSARPARHVARYAEIKRFPVQARTQRDPDEIRTLAGSRRTRRTGSATQAEAARSNRAGRIRASKAHGGSLRPPVSGCLRDPAVYYRGGPLARVRFALWVAPP